MPLEWKTSKVGEFEVTHWAKHDPTELVKAITSAPLKEFGKTRPVLIYDFGPHRIAVRNLFRNTRIFDLLKQTIDAKTIVEMPVALFKKEGQYFAATLWRKNTVPFGEFLHDPKVSKKRKRNAALNAVKKLARLHAAGFLHQHPKVENFVVGRRDNAMLVDYKFIGGGPTEKNYRLHDVYFYLDSFPPLRLGLFFKRKVREEYEKWYEYYRRKRG